MNPMAMAGMNPQMAQQMQLQQMQQMQQMQMQQMQPPRSQGSQSPAPGNGSQSARETGQKMQQQAQSSQSGQNGNYGSNSAIPTGPSSQEQLVFEQQKYEQQSRRAVHDHFPPGGGANSWEGMYDDVPQPGIGSGGRGGSFGGYRGGSHRGHGPKGPQASAPANAPTGPKNAGVPGANYRGGGRGGRANYHPYRR